MRAVYPGRRVDVPAQRRLGDYDVGALLGQGSFGEVREAVRRSDGRSFALKILRSSDEGSIKDLRHEARTLWNLRVAGLATPCELGVDGGHWFVAMPKVDGTDISSASRAIPRADRDAWISDKIGQLGATLATLHRCGLLHLDIKPDNILVAGDGRVTLVDFGLSRWMGSPPPGALTLAVERSGSLQYMAPELLSGEQPTEAADWYSVGAVLYELLRGSPPSFGWSCGPPTMGPSTLERLCEGLLAPDPRARLGDTEVGDALGRRNLVLTPRASRLVGRERELDHLTRLRLPSERDEGPPVLVLTGDAGVGKSRLLLETAAGNHGRPIMVGRCYEHEKTPYKGFEGVAEYIERAGEASHEAACFLFPGRGDARTEDRAGSYRAFAELLVRMVGEHGAQLVIDDLHWIDEDGELLLATLLASRPTAIGMLLAASRSQTAIDRLRERLDRAQGSHVSLEVVALEGLPREAATELVRDCAPSLDGPSTAAIVDASQGSPFALEMLSSSAWELPTPAPPSITTIVGQRFELLTKADRAALEVIALSAGPIEERAVIHACQRLDAPEPSFSALRSTAWVQSRPGSSTHIALYHDVLREAVVASLAAQRRREVVTALLHGLECVDARPAERFPHALSLGQNERAAVLAVTAAREAEAVYAFEAAAQWYGRALEIGEGPWLREQEVSLHAARAWYAAGRPTMAAPQFLQAAEQGNAGAHEWHVQDAADAMMIGGEIARGRALLAPWMRRYGVPEARSFARVALSLMIRLLLLRVPALERLSRSHTPSARARLTWTLSKGLAFAQPLEALDYALRALRFAILDRDTRTLTTVLAFVGGGVLYHAGPLRARGERYLRQARQLAEEVDEPALHGQVLLWTGIRELDEGDWTRASQTLARATATFSDPSSGHWERLLAEQSRLWILWKRGEFRDLAEAASRGLITATERGDALSRAVYLQYVAYPQVAAGTLEAATRAMAALASEWSREAFTVQAFYGAVILTKVHCMGERIDEAFATWSSVQREFRRAGGHRAPIAHVENLEAEARVRILRGRQDDVQALGRIAKDLLRVGKETSSALATWVEAASTGGDVAVVRRSAASLRTAGFEAAALALELQAGDAEARDGLAARGVASPEHWARSIYPIARTPR